MATVLRERLLRDPSALVRGDTASAYRQVWYRMPQVKEAAERDFAEALASEEDEYAVGVIVISLQTIARRRFQSPLRAGIQIMNHQLTALKKALELPRVNLFIADDGSTRRAQVRARDSARPPQRGEAVPAPDLEPRDALRPTDSLEKPEIS